MIHKDPTQEEQQRTEQREILEWQAIEAQKSRDHDIDLRKIDAKSIIDVKQLELKAANLRFRATMRSEVWRRVLVGVIKLPTIPFAVSYIFVLHLMKRDIPESLANFLEL